MGSDGRLKMANLEVLLSASATTTESMPTAPDVIPAHANTREEPDLLVVELSGNWRITAERPDWGETLGKRSPKAVRLVAGEVESWDSSLLLFWGSARRWCADKGVPLDDR